MLLSFAAGNSCNLELFVFFLPTVVLLLWGGCEVWCGKNSSMCMFALMMRTVVVALRNCLLQLEIVSS